jgi:hypothetical protein
MTIASARPLIRLSFRELRAVVATLGQRPLSSPRIAFAGQHEVKIYHRPDRKVLLSA